MHQTSGLVFAEDVSPLAFELGIDLRDGYR